MTKYNTDNTSTLSTGQFTKTVSSAGTPEKLWPGVAQIFTVQTIADVGGALGGKYFDCHDSVGAVRVWLDVGNTSTAPAIAGNYRLLEVNISSGASANTIAAAINTAIDADAEFISTVLTDTITVTQAIKGPRQGPAAVTSGFTVGVSTAGVDVKKLVPSVSFTGRKARGTNNTGLVYWGQSSTNDAQLKMLSPGETVSLFAPEGGSIDLGQFYLDVVTAADGVIVAYPATQQANAAVVIDQTTPGTTNAVAATDSGPTWTTATGIAGARFTSADQSGAVASVTSAPTSGQKLVITDIIISVDSAMRVDFNCESSGTVIETVYMAANSTVNLITRSKRKLATADKKLQVQTSASGNISVNAFYYSEA